MIVEHLTNLYRNARARFTGDAFLSTTCRPDFHQELRESRTIHLQDGAVYLPTNPDHIEVFCVAVGDQVLTPGQEARVTMAVLTARGREHSEVMRLPYHQFVRNWRRDSNNTFYNTKQHRCLPL